MGSHSGRTRATLARVVIAFLLCIAPALAPRASAQDGPPKALREAIGALVRLLESHDDDAIRSFAADRLTNTYRASFQGDALFNHFRAIRDAAGGSISDIGVEQTPAGLVVRVSGAKDVVIRIDVDDAGRFTLVELADPAQFANADDEAPAVPVTWETLDARLAQAERAGLAGVFVAQRDGHTVVRKACGMADRDRATPTALSTVYGIGSAPIDFTVTSILLLAQRGALDLDDPITRFLHDVSTDKRAMTIRHLMTGKSGLPNFHHIPEIDWDPDLAWIDRDTGVARILALPLLFAPGTGEAHSHSAFGLLAAIVEIASGRTYPEFVRTEILGPAGMSRTGFYGETAGLTQADFAVGYGVSSVGLPNIPPNWGPTSWLVMGSGGMFSTIEDMIRYQDAIDAGKILNGQWKAWQSDRAGVSNDGSDRGFLFFRATNGRGTRIALLMNMDDRAPEIRSFIRGLEHLVQ